MDDPGSVTENNITVKLSKDKKSPRKHNPKLSVFRKMDKKKKEPGRMLQYLLDNFSISSPDEDLVCKNGHVLLVYLERGHAAKKTIDAVNTSFGVDVTFNGLNRLLNKSIRKYKNFPRDLQEFERICGEQFQCLATSSTASPKLSMPSAIAPNLTTPSANAPNFTTPSLNPTTTSSLACDPSFVSAEGLRPMSMADNSTESFSVPPITSPYPQMTANIPWSTGASRSSSGSSTLHADDVSPQKTKIREFALATAHLCVTAHTAKQSGLANRQEGARPYFACDLLSRTGIAGLQWKKHLGGAVHVTVSEQKETQTLQDNTQHNGFTLVPFPLDPSHPPGNLLPEQDHSEVHLARCDPMVLLLLEAFDFIYIDPHKTPVPYFSTVFRNVRNGGVVSFVIADTMQFARSPHVVRRWYGAHCMKTEYLKELAVRIILATLAEEAAKCNKAFTVMYALCLEDFLFLTVRVERGLKLADSMLQQNIGHVLHCRICEERAFYPDSMAPVETPYSLLPCDCGRNIPGKTAVIIGPVWKGRIYDYSCLGKLAESGRVLGLSPAFFSLLQGAMQDCLCDTPPSLYDLCGPPTNVDPAQQNHGDQSCVDQLQSNGRSSETSCVHDSERQGIDNTSEDHSSRPCQEDRTVKDTHEDTKNNDLNFDGKKKDTSTCKTKEDVEQISKDRDCAEADNLEKNYVRSNSSCKLDNDSSHTENDKRSVSAKNTDNSLPEENNHILSSDTNDHSSSLQRSNTSMISKIKQPDTEPLFDGRTHLKEDIVKNHTVKQTESEENVTNNLTVQETKAEEGGDDKKRGVKRPTSGLVTEAECHQQKRVKVASEPAPCFYYNMHSKRMCTGRLPRYQLVVERLRALGYRSCRTHFEKYAIRTDATMKVLTDLVGSTDNKVLYVKGSRPR